MTRRSATSEASGLRILLAHDLSPSADTAVAMVGQADWPMATSVRVVTSPVGIGPLHSSFGNLREARAHAQTVRSMIAFAHERASADLGRAGLIVETATIRGEPGRAIVAEAERSGADLIVVGARGQDAVAAAILGSVSRAVAERASCSVLVARGIPTRRVLLATDGSGPAAFATSIVATWPMFASAEVLLVSVASPPPRSPRAILGDAAWRTNVQDSLAAATGEACDVVERALGELDAPGRAIDVEVRVGEVDTEIAAAARTWPTDLVVLGVNGRPLVQRLFLGTVARKVLASVTASVLVARPPAMRDAPDPSPSTQV